MLKRLIGLALLLAACSAPVAVTTSTSLPPTSTSPPSITSSPTTAATTTATAPPTTSTPLQGLVYTEIAAGLPFPTNLTVRPSDGALFLTTKDGQVWSFEGGEFQSVFDISAAVVNRGEQGLLGMAWHPSDDSRFYLHYTDINGDTTITEYTNLDPSQNRLLLKLADPASNHNGGTIAFGPDGYLWIAMGDGGGGGDSFATGQTTDDLFASILRIDVDGGDPYGIPEDNPFAEEGGAPEVWAIGLRNPWRLSFDGDLVYIGDVGQGAYEEINVASAAVPALNYGWSITEGLHCFEPAEDCDTSGLTLPLVEVPHSDAGTCSITGGVVYRGTAIPELAGHYLYSDYCGGWLRSFRFDGNQATEQQDWTEQVGIPGSVVSFGTDALGEVYVLTDESVLRIDPVR